MANYYEHARSNYFRVAEGKAEAFEDWCNRIGVEFIKNKQDDDYMIYPSSDCGWPSYIWNDEEGQEEEDIDVCVDIAQFLAEDSVAVFMGVGYEKLRYLNGYAIAVDCSGERVYISLDDIYTRARDVFPGKSVTPATY
jgi:hypothetical protein